MPAADPPGRPASHSTDAAGDPSRETAPLGSRFLALLVDWVLCLMLASLVARPPDTGIWVYPFLFVEYAFFVGLYTQTPGMWLAKVRCVSVTDTGPVGMVRALVRTVLMCLVVPVLVMDEFGRGIHDRATGSIMLSAPRERR